MLVKDNPRHKSNCDLLANTCFAHVLASGIQNSSSQCACVQLALDPYLYGTPTLSAQKSPFGPSTEIRMPRSQIWTQLLLIGLTSHGFHPLWPGIGHLLGVLGPTSTRIHRYQHSSGFSGCKYFFLLKYVELKSLISDYALENCLLHIGIILMPLYNSLCKLWQRGVGTVQSFLCSNDLSEEEVCIEIVNLIC